MLGFRVWDKNNECFIESEYVSFWMSQDGKLWEVNDEGESYESDPYFYIPMQSTGLKDSNGNLIYEGDVLAHIALEDKNHPKYYLYPHDAINFVYSIGYEKIGLLRNRIILNYKIIGNIYENSELLEQLK